jgi:hypothetical protein
MGNAIDTTHQWSGGVIDTAHQWSSLTLPTIGQSFYWHRSTVVSSVDDSEELFTTFILWNCACFRELLWRVLCDSIQDGYILWIRIKVNMYSIVPGRYNAWFLYAVTLCNGSYGSQLFSSHRCGEIPKGSDTSHRVAREYRFLYLKDILADLSYYQQL